MPERERSRDRSSHKRTRRSRDRRSRSHSSSYDSTSPPRSRDRSPQKKLRYELSDESSQAISDSSIVKAAVSESNGEISCTIEETNRIRALLGLKPLNNIKSKEEVAVQNFKNLQRTTEESDIKQRIEKMKEKRLLKEKLDGKGLGDIGNEEELSSAASWVQRSRQKEVSDKEKARLAAEAAAKRLQEEEDENAARVLYTGSDLRGIAVKHGVDDFEAGDVQILTLADSQILAKDEDGHVLGVNEDGDVLENVTLADRDRRLEREKRLKRLKQPLYAAYDDDEFAEGVAPGTRRSILPQYDAEKVAGPKLVLGENGSAMAMGNGIEVKSEEDKKVIPQSLLVETREMSEYLTATEFASFAKKSKKDKAKKKRKIRKQDSSSLIEELEAALDTNEGEEGDIGMADRGARGSISARSGVLQEEEAARRAAYDHAVKVADEKSKAVAMRLGRGAGGGNERVNEEDDDAEIAESLARARRLALQKQKQLAEEEAGDRVSKMVAERVKKQADLCQHEAASQASTGVIVGLDDANALDAEGRKKDGTLVFTSTTEFTTRLQARLNEKARSRAEAAIRDMERTGDDDSDEEGTSGASSKNKSKKSKKILVRREGDTESGWVELDEEAGMEVVAGEFSSGSEDEKEEEVHDDQLEFLHRQPTQAKGLAATLALLKGSGDLHHKDQLAGRAKDTREIDPSARDFGVKLEYRDENGLKLTQKEAFRQLSYRFHGINPGTKKKNKRIREQQALLKSSGNAAETGTMKSLTRAQEATGKAHITVQGGMSSGASAAQLAASIAQKKAKAAAKGGKSK